MKKNRELISGQSERIADVFYGWLQDEVKSSGQDRNAYLDDYNRAIEGLKSGWGDHNLTAGKHESHMTRLPIWFEAFTLAPDDDNTAAHLTFAGLMEVSGSFRNKCYVQAANAEDYLERRQAAVGIDHKAAVNSQLTEHLPPEGSLSEAYLNEGGLRLSMNFSIKTGDMCIEGLVKRISSGEDLMMEKSPSVTLMNYAQLNWLRFATDCVTLFAKQRKGQLSRVPLLEPKSISATPPPKVIYPFE